MCALRPTPKITQTFANKYAVLMFAAAMLVPTASGWAQTAFESGCSALRGLKISASQIAPPTAGASLEEAAWVARTDSKPATCLVSGAIHSLRSGSPDIRFKIVLPEKWNGKAVQLGGGGYDGSVAERANFLPEQPSDKGYASYGSDSGHQGPPTSAAFALDPEALENYAGAQIKKTHDVATAVLLKLYGKAPTRTYFYGNSHGGNEALQAIHSFPSDYDGVIAIHPAYDTIAVQVGGILASQVMYGSASSWISLSKLNAVGQAVLEACDGLDGARDGLISNTAACRQKFKIESLRCPGDGGSDSACLTEAQIVALRKLASPLQFGFALKGGVSSFGGWPVFEGAFTDPHNPSGWGNRPVPGAPPTSDDAAQFIMADQAIRYLVTKDDAVKSLAFVPSQHIAQLQKASELVDASDPDLDAFIKHGGKLLLMHGTVDMLMPPNNSIKYYDALKARYRSKLRNSVRFYIAPGFGHGDGPFRVVWDSLDALDRWVSGQDPGPQTAFDASTEGHGRSRPLCEYPQWPKYNGAGNLGIASSFSCIK